MPYEKTDLTVEWDLDNHVAYSESLGGREPQSTGILRAGENTVWLPVVRDYPSGYVPGQLRLLGDTTYAIHSDGTKVVATYPDADFSPQAFRDNARLIAQERAQQALSETDWYIIRQMELGTPPPASVAQGRNAVRAAAQSEQARVTSMTPAELQDYDAVEINNSAKTLKDSVRADRLSARTKT